MDGGLFMGGEGGRLWESMKLLELSHRPSKSVEFGHVQNFHLDVNSRKMQWVTHHKIHNTFFVLNSEENGNKGTKISKEIIIIKKYGRYSASSGIS